MPQEFIEQLITTLKTMLPDACDISVQEVTKQAEERLTALYIRSDETNISPIIYIDSLYQHYCHGASIENLALTIKQIYEQNSNPNTFDTTIITDWDKAKQSVCARLINAKRNKSYLEEKVTMDIEGTNLVYMYFIDIHAVKDGSVPITKSIFKNWNVSLEKLHEIACANTQRLYPAYISPMGELMEDLAGDMGMDEIPELPVDSAMYVITNRQKIHGAISALYPDTVKRLHEALGDFYLLPSSIHEMLAVPASITQSPEDLLHMVVSINHAGDIVNPQDILADNVFIMKDFKLTPAFNNEQRMDIIKQELSWLPFPEEIDE